MPSEEDDSAALTATALDTRPDPHAATSGASSPRPLSGYALGQMLGRGGMGEVYAARDERIERDVAVKRIREVTPSAEATARFLREAKIQARLDHPAIVPVHELGVDADGRPYFTMKRLAGETLVDRLARRERGAPIQPLLRPLVDVCFAIAHAHARGIVHRDLKPSNIMLGDFGEVYVLDWGVARELDTHRISSPTVEGPGVLDDDATRTGAMLGTPGYMPPEQMRGAEVTTAFDVYSLGAILFEILTGDTLLPHGEKAIEATLAFKGDAPSKRRPELGIPPELDALCAAALAPDPSRRPNAREIAERLQRYVDGDRDVERRRAMARTLLDEASVALVAGDRAIGLHKAGRALALDPESTTAAVMVTELIVAPPAELPAPLVATIASAEREIHRQSSARAARMFFSILFVLPFVPFVEVRNWTPLIALIAVSIGMGTLSWINARTGKIPPLVLLGGTLVVLLAISRLSSPFIFLPTMTLAMVFAFAARPSLSRRRWVMRAFVTVAVLGPFALEWLGVFAPTWRVEPDGLVTWSTMFMGARTLDIALVIAGNFVIVAFVARYVVTGMTARHDAQRKVEIQAWHLRQLLPGAIADATNRTGRYRISQALAALTNRELPPELAPSREPSRDQK